MNDSEMGLAPGSLELLLLFCVHHLPGSTSLAGPGPTTSTKVSTQNSLGLVSANRPLWPAGLPPSPFPVLKLLTTTPGRDAG